MVSGVRPTRKATGLAVGSPGPGWALAHAQGRPQTLLVHAPPKLPIVLQLAEGQHPTTSTQARLQGADAGVAHSGRDTRTATKAGLR
jgi:hypothetical protein